MTTLQARQQLQKLLNVDSDGQIGKATTAAFEALKAASPESTWPPAASVEPPVPLPDGIDLRSAGNIATLLPPVRVLAIAFLQKLKEAGIDAKIISGTRTYAEQDALYAQGRTTSGKIVTNARGGYSWHNHQVAFDIGLFVNGKYLDDSPLYAKAGAIGESLGLEWGGRWVTITDFPHYQLTRGKTLADARMLHDQGKSLLA